MQEISSIKRWPEVLVSSKDQASKIYKAVAKSELRKIGPRLYTPNMVDDAEKIISDNLWRVIGLLAPGAVVSYRTAIEGRPLKNTVYLGGARDMLQSSGPTRYTVFLSGRPSIAVR